VLSTRALRTPSSTNPRGQNPEGLVIMSERSTLRGSRLGAPSYEDERGVEFAERQRISYDCPRGHRFVMVFSTEAEVPPLWDCPKCGEQGLQVQTDRPEEKAGKPARTHWDMLLERRSVDELQTLLDERLELLRAGRISGATHMAQPPDEQKSA